jgi:hypothetical protein
MGWRLMSAPPGPSMLHGQAEAACRLLGEAKPSLPFFRVPLPPAASRSPCAAIYSPLINVRLFELQILALSRCGSRIYLAGPFIRCHSPVVRDLRRRRPILDQDNELLLELRFVLVTLLHTLSAKRFNAAPVLPNQCWL